MQESQQKEGSFSTNEAVQLKKLVELISYILKPMKLWISISRSSSGVWVYRAMPIAIRFEAVRFVVHAQKSTAMGLWACSHRKCLEFRGDEIASGGILRPTQCFKEARQQFHMFKYPPFLPIASYSTDLVFGFPIVCLSLKPHPSQIRLRLEARQVVAKK